MFIYLAKKINLPSTTTNTTITCLDWNNSSGWLVCGGQSNLLKVLNLPIQTPCSSQHPSKSSPSQTLEGHSGNVIRCVWNFAHNKLTTADSNGMIMVWVMYNGLWYEEMVNDRPNSTVADFCWNHSGDLIIIAYTDGNIIIGGVNGNRVLGSDLGFSLSQVTWSPDSRFILFASNDDKSLKLFDSRGNYQHKVSLHAGTDSIITGLEWFTPTPRFQRLGPSVPSLAIVFNNGKVQLNRHERDSRPILLDTSMSDVLVKWSPSGAVLAVGGYQVVKGPSNGERRMVVVQLYTAMGVYLRYLKVPQGSKISAMSWDAFGLQLALGLGSSIYLCKVHPMYQAAVTKSGTVCYVQPIAASIVPSIDVEDKTICWFDRKSGSLITKSCVPGFQLLAHYKDFVAIISLQAVPHSKNLDKKSTASANNSPYSGSVQCIASVVNSLGTPLDTRVLGWFRPVLASMTGTYLILSDGVYLVYFPFQQSGSASTLSAMLWERESAIKVARISLQSETGLMSPPTLYEGNTLPNEQESSTSSPIVSMAATSDHVVVAHANGVLSKYTFPGLTQVAQIVLPLKPFRIQVNIDASTVSVIDMAGVLRLVSMKASVEQSPQGSLIMNETQQVQHAPQLLDVERKDVWGMWWSEDHCDMYAVMDKSNVCIMRGSEPEQPVAETRYLSGFSDLELTVIDLHTLINQGPNTSGQETDLIQQIPTYALRYTTELIGQHRISDAFLYAETRPHARLWQAVANAALEQSEWGIARTCYERLQDYGGLMWLKHIQSMSSDTLKQRAAVFAYLGKVEQAEKMYIDMDRRDLAIEMHLTLGDPSRVVQFANECSGMTDAILEKCWSEMGHDALSKCQYTYAATCLAQARDFDALAQCYFLSDNGSALDALAHELPTTATSVLLKIGEYLFRFGMAQEAAYALTKCNNLQLAIQVCTVLNHWRLAVELAGTESAAGSAKSGVSDLFAWIEKQLVANGDGAQLVELYRSANQCLKEAVQLFHGAAHAIRVGNVNPILIKKMYVLGALEVDRHCTLNEGQLADVARSLDTGLHDCGPELMALNNPWHGAEAYHFYILAQRQFYAGDPDSALQTAMNLRRYDDILTIHVIYSLIALLAYKCRNFQVCSRALGKLKSVAIDEQDKATYEQIAIDIFTSYSASDMPSAGTIPCTYCQGSMGELDSTCRECHTVYPVCTASGRVIGDVSQTWSCPQCKHRALESETVQFSFCPLCHASMSTDYY